LTRRRVECLLLAPAESGSREIHSRLEGMQILENERRLAALEHIGDLCLGAVIGRDCRCRW